MFGVTSAVFMATLQNALKRLRRARYAGPGRGTRDKLREPSPPAP